MNALSKLHTKNLNCIVLNSLKDAGSGFGYDTNKVSIISNDHNVNEFELKSKNEVASDIFDFITKEVV